MNSGSLDVKIYSVYEVDNSGYFYMSMVCDGKYIIVQGQYDWKGHCNEITSIYID